MASSTVTINLDETIKTIKLDISNYDKLSDSSKIGSSKVIKEKIALCDKIIDSYVKKIETMSDEIKGVDNKITQEEFEEYKENISITEQLILTATSIDESINLYAELLFLVRSCENYLLNQTMQVEYVK